MKETRVYYAIPDEMIEVYHEINNLVESLNDVLVASERHLSLEKWSSDSLKTIIPCDTSHVIFLFFYWKGMPLRAKEDMNEAFKATCVGRIARRLCVFFKEPSDDISADLAEFKAGFAIRYGLPYCLFENNDDLKINFLLQYEAVCGSEVMKVDDCNVVIGNRPFVNLHNVSFVSQNNDNRDLLKLEEELRARLNKIEAKNESTPDDEIKKQLWKANEELSKNREAINENLKSLLDMARVFARYRNGRMSENVRRARRLFESGDAEKAEWWLETENSNVNNDRYRAQERVSNSRYMDDEPSALTTLAYIDLDSGWLLEAEDSFVESLEIYRKRAKNHPEYYEYLVASTLYNLAFLETIHHCNCKVEFVLGESLLMIWKRIHSDDGDDYGDYLMRLLWDLLLFYRENIAKGELTPEERNYWEETREMYFEFEKKTPGRYTNILKTADLILGK